MHAFSGSLPQALVNDKSKLEVTQNQRFLTTRASTPVGHPVKASSTLTNKKRGEKLTRLRGEGHVHLQGLGASDCKRKPKTANHSLAVCCLGAFDQYLNWLVYGVYKSSVLQSNVPRPYRCNRPQAPGHSHSRGRGAVKLRLNVSLL